MACFALVCSFAGGGEAQEEGQGKEARKEGSRQEEEGERIFPTLQNATEDLAFFHALVLSNMICKGPFHIRATSAAAWTPVLSFWPWPWQDHGPRNNFFRARWATVPVLARVNLARFLYGGDLLGPCGPVVEVVAAFLFISQSRKLFLLVLGYWVGSALELMIYTRSFQS